MKKYLVALAVVVVAAAGAGWYAFGRNHDMMSQARAYLDKNDIPAALIALKAAVNSDPTRAEPHLSLGEVQLRTGDPVAAERELKEARRLGADPAEADIQIAQAYVAQGKWKDLLQEFKPDAVATGRRAGILVMRAIAQLGLEDADAARASIAEAERLDPKSADPPMVAARIEATLRNLPAAETDVDRAVTLDGGRVDALMFKAQLLAGRGDRAGAMARLDAAVQKAPNNVGARLQRVELLIAGNQDDKARDDVDAALKLQGRNVVAVFYNAILLTRARKYTEADAELTRVSPSMARLPRGYFYLAIVKGSLGQFEQALDAATKYVARAPEDPQARKLLAQVQLSSGHADQAIETLKGAIDAGQNGADTQDLLGQAYAALGRPNEASHNFEAAAVLAPQSTEVLARLAATRLALGDPAGATGALEKSLEVAPDQAQTNEQIAQTAMAAGDNDRAAMAIDKLRTQTGETETVANLNGMLQLSRGDPEGARAAFVAAMLKFPDAAAPKLNLARVLILLGRPADAEPILAAVLAKDPANPTAFGLLLSLYVQSDRNQQAIALTQAALTTTPNAPALQSMLADLYVRANDPQHAITYLDGVTRGINPVPITLQAARARAQAAAHLTSEAYASYDAILRANPNDAEARRQLIEMLGNANDLAGAKAVAMDGLKVNPGNGPLQEILLRIERRLNGVNGALALADQLRKDPVNAPTSLRLKGDLYMLEQRPAEAALAYLAEYKAAPSSDLAQRIANADIAANKPNDGVQVLRGWVSDHADDVPAMRMLGSMELTAKRYAEAGAAFETSLAKDPNDVVALNNLAWIYQQRNDPRAKATALRAYTRAPNADTADTLGWIMLASDKQGALNLLQEARAQRPDNRTILYHLAVALRDNGRRQEAIDVLKPVVADAAAFDEKADAQRVLRELTAAP